MLETLTRDLQTAVRGLRAAPGFTGVVLAVLTLAMGATTAVFSVVDAVALQGLPFDEAGRLVAIHRTISGKPVISPFSAPEFLALRARPDVFQGLAAVTDGPMTLRRDSQGPPEILRGQRVSAEFFMVLRVAPAIGRAFTIDHEIEGSERVAVISYGLWQRRFGRSSDVVEKRLPAEGGDVQILGVMPRDFAYPVGAVQPTEVWVPYVIPNNERAASISAYLRLVGRLKDGITIDGAQARIDASSVPGDAVGGGVGREWRPAIRSLYESLVGDTRSWMLMLLASVTCVLLIACFNIANLLLVRATVRVRELGVRSALGATRWDLARLLLAESLVLSTIGSALGTLVALWGIEALRSLLPPGLPRVANIGIDWRVLAASAGAALVTGVTIGLAPVFHSSRAIDQVLKQNGRTDTASGRRQWLRTTLLVAEVAMAVVLLVGASLFLTSFARLMRIDIGLDYRDVLVVDVRPTPATSGAGGTTAQNATAARLMNLLQQVREIPGVETAAMATANLPFSLRMSSRPFGIPGRELPRGQGGISFSQVSPDYFHTLGVRLVKGRSFTDADGRGTELVAILNETAAGAYFPNQDPIGQVVSAAGSRTIVGVVADVRGFGPEQPVERESFAPLAEGRFTRAALVLRSKGNRDAIVPQVKAAIWSAFPDVAIPAPRTLEEGFGVFIAQRRFSMLLLSLFGLLGVAIAGVGIYGVMTYVVAQRTREIGIRMALGARSSAILWSVLRRASAQVAVGLLAGLGMAWLLATSVEKFLFRVEPHDLRLYAAVCIVLAATALAAALWPARRAARVDPLVALRLD